MDFFIKDNGTIKTYKQDDCNIDNVNNGKLLLLLYRVTLKDKYLKAANLLWEQLRHQPRTNEGGAGIRRSILTRCSWIVYA